MKRLVVPWLIEVPASFITEPCREELRGVLWLQLLPGDRKQCRRYGSGGAHSKATLMLLVMGTKHSWYALRISSGCTFTNLVSPYI